MQRVLLDTGLDGARLAWLRAMTGADELAAEAGTVPLLDRLLVSQGPGAVPPGAAARLPVADRDRLIASLHQEQFGDAIEADAACPGCRQPFALRFHLIEVLAEHRPAAPDGVTGPDEMSCYERNGVRFRLPSTMDVEAALARQAADRPACLLAGCILAGDPAGQEAAIEAAMAALGPTLDLDLTATCPHCTGAAALRFEIGAYFLKSVMNGRRFLLREVHRIARAYAWSCAEIMELPGRVRQDLVRLIEGDPSRSAGPPPRSANPVQFYLQRMLERPLARALPPLCSRRWSTARRPFSSRISCSG